MEAAIVFNMKNHCDYGFIEWLSLKDFKNIVSHTIIEPSVITEDNTRAYFGRTYGTLLYYPEEVGTVILSNNEYVLQIINENDEIVTIKEEFTILRVSNTKTLWQPRDRNTVIYNNINLLKINSLKDYDSGTIYCGYIARSLQNKCIDCIRNPEHDLRYVKNNIFCTTPDMDILLVIASPKSLKQLCINVVKNFDNVQKRRLSPSLMKLVDCKTLFDHQLLLEGEKLSCNDFEITIQNSCLILTDLHLKKIFSCFLCITLGYIDRKLIVYEEEWRGYYICVLCEGDKIELKKNRDDYSFVVKVVCRDGDWYERDNFVIFGRPFMRWGRSQYELTDED